jgi:UDP-glucose:(heptosyl)LPS alpha-1,3-glucosyltransferase
MKLALVIFNGDPARGGAERYTADIGRLLAERGHDVHLMASKFGESIPGVGFVGLPTKGASRGGQYLAFMKGLAAHLAAHRYDVVHAMLPVPGCDIYHPHAGMAKASLQSHLGREVIASRALAKLGNRLNRKRRLYVRTEERMLHGSNPPIVLCLSDYIKASILKHYPDIDGLLQKLFNAVDLAKFDPEKSAGARERVRTKYGIPTDAPVALMIAQHFERKGLAELISATAQLNNTTPNRSLYVLVVGKDDPAASRQMARQLGVEDRIIFAGTTTAPADFYAASDFFVLPTRHDSCSLVALESLAMGVPVISTVFNGACEIMEQGVHGFVLAEPANVGALIDAMRQVLDDNRRSAMHEACLALRPRLAYAAHIDRLEEIYRLRLTTRRR